MSKYRFTIVSPHPDDEFIGCRRFFQCYKNNIDGVIFLTNGERSNYDFPDMLGYIATRRVESETWIRKQNKNIQIFYLNFPDAQEIVDPNYSFGLYKMFNNETPIFTLYKKLCNFAGDNIILCPNKEKHPSHGSSNDLCTLMQNKKIYYSIHGLFLNQTEKSPGTYTTTIKMFGNRLFNYSVILDDLKEKENEFRKYYGSQYEIWKKGDLNMPRYENYMSEIPLKLDEEDKTYVSII